MMPILARLRHTYERVTLPLGCLCLRCGLTANSLTYLSFALSMLAGYLIASSHFWWGVAGILLVGLTDILDGATARASGTAGPYGMVLDHVTDRYAEFFLLGGVLLSGVVDSFWVLFALFGMIMASYVRAKAESTGFITSCNVGFAGRQEKLALLIVGLVVQPLMSDLPILTAAVIAVGVASHITVAQRLIYTRQQLLAARSPDLRQDSGLLP